MNVGQKIAAGVLVAVAMFFVVQVLLAIGSILISLIVAVITGALAIAALSAAARMMDKDL